MTKDRYRELNSLWNTSPIFAIVDAYKEGGNDAVADAIMRLPQQYEEGTFLGDNVSAYQVLSMVKSTYETAVADNLHGLEEYTEYIEKLEADDPSTYECIYMLDFLGSNMYNLLTK